MELAHYGVFKQKGPAPKVPPQTKWIYVFKGKEIFLKIV